MGRGYIPHWYRNSFGLLSSRLVWGGLEKNVGGFNNLRAASDNHAQEVSGKELFARQELLYGLPQFWVFSIRGAVWHPGYILYASRRMMHKPHPY